jgi:hypothetical protein
MSSPDSVSKLAGLFAGIENRRVRLEALQDQCDLLERDGVVIVRGERDVLAELRSGLGTAMAVVHRLADPGAAPVDGDGDRLGRLDELLGDVKWNLLDDIRALLDEKAVLHRDTLANYREGVDAWRRALVPLGASLQRARTARAPVTSELHEYREWESRVSQAERALSERRYDVLVKSLKALGGGAGQPGTIEQRARDIDAKVAAERPLLGQADLLLLRSPLDERRIYRYTVLLRTPSEQGPHGVNIQGESALVRQDRDWMSAALGRISGAVTTELASRFERARAAASAPATGSVPATGAAPATSPAPVPGTPAIDTTTSRGSFARSQPRTMDELIRDMGDFMYQLILPEDMKRYLDETPCSLTITTNDQELPWELMVCRDEFLCLGRPVARMPMGREFPRAHPRRSGTKLRFLLIYADPDGNLHHAREEVEALRNALVGEWQDRIEVQMLQAKEASGQKLNDVLRRDEFDIIHFAGHAMFDAKEPELSGLMLDDKEIFSAQKIRRLLRGRPLVFLNACDSACTATAAAPQKAEYLLKESNEGLASAFIYGGALGCIGSLWPIYDRPAAEFAIECYRGLLCGQMIGQAMRDARKTIKQRHPNQITWAAFVLYGDPTFRLTEGEGP